MDATTAPTAPRLVDALLTAVPGDLFTFRRICSSIEDWAAVVASAREQGVLAVLLHYVAEAKVDLPESVVGAARRHCAVEQMWTSQVIAALEAILPRLHADGIKSVALKGPVLAQRLYPDVALRPSIDVDLLVDGEQFEAANGVLRALGYQGQSGAAATYALAHEHHMHFERPGTPTVELHFRLYAGFGTVLGAREALSRAVSANTASGETVRVLAPEDEVLYLALHAAGHSYVRLLWLYDLKLLLGRFAILDWMLIADRARSAGVLEALAFTCSILRDRLGVATPTASQLGAATGTRWRLARRLLPTVMKPTARSARENFESLIFTCLLCDHWMAGFRLVRHHTSRAVKRRVYRAIPSVAPERWSA